MRAMPRQPWTWPPTQQRPMMPMVWRSSPRSGSFVRCAGQGLRQHARTHVGGGAEPAGADHDRALQPELMKTFGLVVPAGKGSRFEAHVRALNVRALNVRALNVRALLADQEG